MEVEDRRQPKKGTARGLEAVKQRVTSIEWGGCRNGGASAGVSGADENFLRGDDSRERDKEVAR